MRCVFEIQALALSCNTHGRLVATLDPAQPALKTQRLMRRPLPRWAALMAALASLAPLAQAACGKSGVLVTEYQLSQFSTECERP